MSLVKAGHYIPDIGRVALAWGKSVQVWRNRKTGSHLSPIYFPGGNASRWDFGHRDRLSMLRKTLNKQLSYQAFFRAINSSRRILNYRYGTEVFWGKCNLRGAQSSSVIGLKSSKKQTSDDPHPLNFWKRVFTKL